MNETPKVRRPNDGSSVEKPVAPKKKGAKPRKPATEKKSELHRELVVRLQRLRSAAKEISRAYLANLERDILEIVDTVNERGDRGGKKKGVKQGLLERMIDITDQLSLKPEKGRRKDLKKIERALGEILNAIDKGKG